MQLVRLAAFLVGVYHLRGRRILELRRVCLGVRKHDTGRLWLVSPASSAACQGSKRCHFTPFHDRQVNNYNCTHTGRTGGQTVFCSRLLKKSYELTFFSLWFYKFKNRVVSIQDIARLSFGREGCRRLRENSEAHFRQHVTSKGVQFVTHVKLCWFAFSSTFFFRSERNKKRKVFKIRRISPVTPT